METDIKQFILDEKRNTSKAERYKRAINQCCDPECNFGFGLLTHHILPISKGGTDTYDNFIVLCKKCHNANHNHKAEDIRRIELQTYKIYAERLLLGFTSKDMTDEQFDVLLRAKLKNKDIHEDCTGCPTTDGRKTTTSEPDGAGTSAILSVVSLDGEDSNRYHYFIPLYRKNGNKRIIINIR